MYARTRVYTRTRMYGVKKTDIATICYNRICSSKTELQNRDYIQLAFDRFVGNAGELRLFEDILPK